MDDAEILQRIAELVEQEHALERSHQGAPAAPEDVERVRQLEVMLDQCWDLLRQRQGRRDAGQNPDDASVRGESTVEGYNQ